MPYSIIWLIFLHILPKLGIVAMNAVIILRLKRAFARPSLQENRSQAMMIANETSSSAAAYSTDVENTQNNKTAKITRSSAKTRLCTIHEEISTVSQVIFTEGGGGAFDRVRYSRLSQRSWKREEARRCARKRDERRTRKK